MFTTFIELLHVHSNDLLYFKMKNGRCPEGIFPIEQRAIHKC